MVENAERAAQGEVNFEAHPAQARGSEQGTAAGLVNFGAANAELKHGLSHPEPAAAAAGESHPGAADAEVTQPGSADAEVKQPYYYRAEVWDTAPPGTHGVQKKVWEAAVAAVVKMMQKARGAAAKVQNEAKEASWDVPKEKRKSGAAVAEVTQPGIEVKQPYYYRAEVWDTTPGAPGV